MPEDEFYLMKICDALTLSPGEGLCRDKAKMKRTQSSGRATDRIGAGVELESIEKDVNNHVADASLGDVSSVASGRLMIRTSP